LGLGTAKGAAYRTAQGEIRHARLDAASLRAMAAAGGGRYATLTAGTDDLAGLDVLDATAAARAGASDDQATTWRDDGYWLPWRRADQVRHERMQDGTDAYRREDYAAASKAWEKLPGADAAYNRGNALAHAGRYEDAIAAYDEALRLQPGMEDAVANRKLVED